MTQEFLKAFVQSMNLVPITPKHLESIAADTTFIDKRFLQVTETRQSYLLELVHLVESLEDRIRVESGFFDGRPNVTTYRKSNARKFGQSAKSMPTLFEFDYEKFAEFDIMIKSLEISRKCQMISSIPFDSDQLQTECKNLAEQVHDIVPRTYDQLNVHSNLDIWQKLGANTFRLFGKDINQYKKVQPQAVDPSQVGTIVDISNQLTAYVDSDVTTHSYEQMMRTVNLHLEKIAHCLYQSFPFGTLDGEDQIKQHWFWTWLANN